MPTFINFGAIQRATRVEILKVFGIMLVISLVLMLILSLILKSFYECEGAFGDTVHLDLRDHPNYDRLYNGKCIEEYHGEEDHKFPFIARFVVVNDTEKYVFCSGSLISESLILTAAHCLTIDDNIIIEIHLGGTAENQFRDKVVITKEDFTKILHPKYNAKDWVNDIALVKLKHKIALTEKIQRICLPLQDEQVPTNLTLPAWNEKNMVDHPKIQELFIHGVSLFNCSQSYYDLLEQKALKRINPNNLPQESKNYSITVDYKSITPKQFCAGEKTQKRGNSGMPGSFRSSSNRPYTIYGILSYGTKDDHQMPTVFTKIYEYRHWILCKA
ncbi:hypothetical protein ACKWTF_010167 [Chironomus riparius]